VVGVHRAVPIFVLNSLRTRLFDLISGRFQTPILSTADKTFKMSMGQCCATGSLHTGTPTGRMEKLHGLEVYVAEPPTGTTPKGVVVIIPDGNTV
jgi:hypothetical protein